MIQGKIQNAVAFVADLSIVERRPKGGGLINGCVAIEWGWAEQALGSEAMLGVMNTAFGGQSDLPIDIRQHLVRSVFDLSAAEDEARRSQVRDLLTTDLERGLQGAVRGRFFFEIHPAAAPLVARIVKGSEHGLPTGYFPIEDLSEEYGLALDVVEAIVEDLERKGLAKSLPAMGRRPQVSFTSRLFARFDPLYMGWNALHDARIIATDLVQHGSLVAERFLERVGWAPRRLNPALAHLIANGLVLDSKTMMGDRPFITFQVYRNDRTRAFAEGRLWVPEPLEHVKPAVWG